MKKIFLFTILGISALTIKPEVSWAAKKTSACAALDSDKSVFDPEAVLKAHGLDPKEITLKADLNYKFVKKDWMSGLSWGIRVYYKGQEAGFIEIGKPFDRDDVVSITLVQVKPKLGRIKLQGSGLGALLHLMTAAFAYDHFKMVLQISDETYSQELALWENFKKHDLLVPGMIPTIRSEILSGTALNQVRDFFNSHVKNDSSPFETKFLDGYKLP